MKGLPPRASQAAQGTDSLAATQAEPSAQWPFKLGEPVRVSWRYKYHADWEGQALYFAGAIFKPPGGLDCWVSEHWPPRHPGDLTSDWAADDLEALPQPPESA